MKRDKEYVLTIITTYNRARLLTESIESVLAQDYPYKKIIIVDDGSIDETANVCQNYVKKYPEQIIYHYKKNGGCASARNRGLSLVGEDVRYVCFLDDDDRFLPGKFRREVDLLKENPHANFSYADSVIHDEAGNSEKLVKAAAAGKPNRFAIEHFLTNEVKSGALLYNVEVVRGRRFREDLKYNEDSEFLQRVAIECTAVYSPEPSCWVRWHQGCKSRNLVEINKALLWSALNIIQTYPTFYQTYKGLIDDRIEKIKKDLFIKLLLKGDLREAPLYSSNQFKNYFILPLCLYYKWKFSLTTLIKARIKG